MHMLFLCSTVPEILSSWISLKSVSLLYTSCLGSCKNWHLHTSHIPKFKLASKLKWLIYCQPIYTGNKAHRISGMRTLTKTKPPLQFAHIPTTNHYVAFHHLQVCQPNFHFIATYGRPPKSKFAVSKKKLRQHLR